MGCGLAPVIEAGQGRRLGAAGATGRRELRPLGHGTQGTEMQYGRKRWLARIRNGGRGGHGAVRRDRRPCRDSVAAGGSSPRARLRLRFGAVSPAAPARGHYDRALSAARPEGGRGREGRQTECKRRELQRARARSASTSLRGARDRDGTKGALPSTGPPNKLET